MIAVEERNLLLFLVIVIFEFEKQNLESCSLAVEMYEEMYFTKEFTGF